MQTSELERIIANAYNTFYESHKELYKADRMEYWRQARLYKERELERIKYGRV